MLYYIPVIKDLSEFSFFLLKIIKTYLRLTTGIINLNELVLLNIRKKIIIYLEEIVDMHANKHPRPIQIS